DHSATAVVTAVYRTIVPKFRSELRTRTAGRSFSFTCPPTRLNGLGPRHNQAGLGGAEFRPGSHGRPHDRSPLLTARTPVRPRVTSIRPGRPSRPGRKPPR